MPEHADVSLLIFCVGGCGTNIAWQMAETLTPKENTHLHFVVANTDGPQLGKLTKATETDAILNQWHESGRFHIMQLGETGNGAGTDPEVGRVAAEKKRDEIIEFLKPHRMVLLVGGFGGGTGTGAIPVIGQIANETKTTHLGIISMPRRREAGGRIERAIQGRDFFQATSPAVVIYNDQLSKKGLLLGDAWSVINTDVHLPLLLGLRELIQVVGNFKNLDIQDLTNALNFGNYAQLGFWEAAFGQDISIAGSALLDNPYQNRSIVKRALRFLPWFHGKTWQLDEHDAVIDQINARLIIKLGDPQVELNEGVVTDVDDDRKWVILLSISKDPPEYELGYGLGDKGEASDFKSSKHGSGDLLAQAISGQNGHGGLTALNVHVGGKAEVLQVPLDLAAQYLRLFSNGTRFDAQKVLKEIENFTRVQPDMPSCFSVVRH